MKRLQLHLKDSTQIKWDSLRTRQEFECMTQEGVLLALIRVYLQHNTTPEERAIVKQLDVESATLQKQQDDAESKRVVFREQRLRRWATMDRDLRSANVENFATCLTDIELEEFSSEREALDTLAQQYETE